MLMEIYERNSSAEDIDGLINGLIEIVKIPDSENYIDTPDIVHKKQ